MLLPSPSKLLLPVPTIVESTSCSHLPRLSFGEDSADGDVDSQRPQTPKTPFASSFQWAFGALRGSPSPKPSKRHSRAMADLMDIDNSTYSNSRTRAPFRPSKANKGTPNWQLKQFAEATLGSGSLRKAVKLPEGEDENEWLAVNGMLVVIGFPAGSLCGNSRRFLQPNQPPLWIYNRILQPSKLSRNEGDR